MADSYSVIARLSAQDSGFTSTLKRAASTTSGLGKVVNGLTFGVLTGAGQAAFSAITNGVKGVVSGLNEASATWQTFNGNMSMNGKSAKQIVKTRKSLQAFAEQTIYSSSDMATTYAQLDAVGTKHTTKLVKGFGGLAAAAENPQQAMKTLSQQATQAAAKPYIQWQDFKLMLEQSPAGMAAVAKSMGKTTKQLVKDVQDGTVKTEDFFDAIANVGTNEDFTKLATSYKTMGQAMDGLTETASNKLQPAFDVLSQHGVKAISAINDKIGELNGKKIAKGITEQIEKLSKYWEAAKTAFSGVGTAIGDAVSAVGSSLAKINGAFGSTKNVDQFKGVMQMAANAIKTFAGFVEDNADIIAKGIKLLPKLLAAYMGFRAVSKVGGGLLAFGSGIGKVVGFLSGNPAGLLGKFSESVTKTEKSSKTGGKSLKKLAAESTAFVKKAVGIAIVVAALALLAKALTPLASLGATAVAPLITFGVVVSGLATVLSKFGAGLQKNVVGIGVFAVAVSAVALAMYPIASTGLEGAAAMATFGIVVGALAGVFAILGGALTAGAVGMLAFGATVVLIGAGMALAKGFIEALPPVIKQVGDTIAQVVPVISGAVENIMTAFGNMFTTISDGVVNVIDAISGGFTSVLNGISGVIDSIGNAALNAGNGFKAVAEGIQMITSLPILDMGASLAAVATGIGAIALAGSGIGAVGAAMSQIASSIMVIPAACASAASGFAIIATSAQSSTTIMIAAFTAAVPAVAKASSNMMKQYNRGIKTGMNTARSTARSMAMQVGSAMRAGYSTAYSSGSYMSIGFANGMRSQLGAIQSAANQMVAAANRAVEAKAKIGSPSRVMRQYGAWYGEGWIIGVNSMQSEARRASENLVNLPTAKMNAMTAYNGSLSEQSEYGASYVIVVPVELDGREIAKVTAPYTEAEQTKRTTRRNRKRGKVYA